jgi:hypothetical protein
MSQSTPACIKNREFTESHYRVYKFDIDGELTYVHHNLIDDTYDVHMPNISGEIKGLSSTNLDKLMAKTITEIRTTTICSAKDVVEARKSQSLKEIQISILTDIIKNHPTISYYHDVTISEDRTTMYIRHEQLNIHIALGRQFTATFDCGSHDTITNPDQFITFIKSVR